MSATRLVALLRGINVGGHNRLPMAILREVAANLGCTDIVTYVQSGNLVVTDDDLGTFADRLAGVIADTTGLVIPVITRTADEWRSIVAANPYPDEAAVDPTLVHISVFAAALDDEARSFDASTFAPETCSFSATSTELYLHVPNGLGRSKLGERIMRAPGLRDGTMRNWRTVLAINELL
jgi:uncharacterized protein (DUF1697 family)